MSENIDFKQLGKILNRLAEKSPTITMDECKKSMSLIVNRLESAVVSKTPGGVGGAAGLRGSIFGEVRLFKNKIVGIVGTPVEYAPVVEFGRAPGKYPPPGALLSWVQKILGYSGKEAVSVEFLVSRKIALRGTAGKFMFRDAVNENRGWIESVINSIPDKVTERINRII